MNSSIPKSISTVIHIGAGRCNQLKDYLEAENRRIFLYEVEERFTQALQPFSKRHSRVHVEQCAVVLGEAPNNVSFNCYSDGRYTSTLALSDGFLAQQINLEPTQTMETEALVLTDVLRACSASAENTLLVLDAPNMVTELGSEVLATIFDSVCILQIQAPNDDVYDKALTPFLASVINGHEPHWLVKPLAAETRGFSNWQIERNTLVIELEHTIQQLSGERSDLKKTLEEVQAQHDTRGEQLAAQTSESEAAQAQLNELKARLDTKEQEAGEHAQQLADQVSELQTKVDLKESEKAHLHTTIEDLKTTLATESSEKSALQTQYDALGEQLAAQTSESEAAQAQLNELKARLDTKEQEAGEHAQQLADQVSELQTKIDLKESEKAHLHTALEDLKTTFAKESSEKSALQTQYDALGEQLAAQTSESEAAQARLNELKARLDTKEQEAGEHAQQLADQVSELQTKIDLEESEKAQLHKKIDELNQTLETEAAGRPQLQAQVDKLQQRLEHHEKTQWQLKESEAEAIQAQRLSQKVIAKTQADLNDLRIKYQDKLEEGENLRALVTELRDKLEIAAGLYERLLQEQPEVLERLNR